MGRVHITVNLEEPPRLLEEYDFTSDDPIGDGIQKLGELHRQ